SALPPFPLTLPLPFCSSCWEKSEPVARIARIAERMRLKMSRRERVRMKTSSADQDTKRNESTLDAHASPARKGGGSPLSTELLHRLRRRLQRELQGLLRDTRSKRLDRPS